MAKALKFGTDIINDVSGFGYDVNSLSVAKETSATKILHHMQGTPNTMQKRPVYKNVLLDIYDFFEEKIKKIGGKK